MSTRVNAARMRRRYAARLEQVRQEVLAEWDEDVVPPGWRQGFCEGLRVAQVVITKG